MIPPIKPEKALVIHPQSCNGGTPKNGIHQENQRKRIKTMMPINTKTIDTILVFPPAKYMANNPTMIENTLKRSISIEIKK